METIRDDKYHRVTLNAQTKGIELVWKAQTVDLLVDEFKDTLVFLAKQVEERELDSVLVDVSDFKSGVVMGIDEWRKETIIPIYNRIIKKFAWVLGPTASVLPDDGKPVRNDGESFLNCYFVDIEAARSWLVE